MQKRSKRSKGQRKRKRSSANSFSQFMGVLRKQFGATHLAMSDGRMLLACVYNGKVPPRMPNPQGPSPGAQLTMTQLVKGSDMTLPTGTAVVGSLLRQSSASDVFASFAFALADIPNIASIGALFDQYRIDRIQFRLRTRNNAIFIANSASPNYSTTNMYVATDFDDNAAPTTLLEIQQYDNAQVLSATDSIDLVLDPAVTPSIFSGGAFSGYAVDEGDKYWLDLANTGIPHYGLKIGLSALVTSTTQRFDWDVEAWYKVSFRNVR